MKKFLIEIDKEKCDGRHNCSCIGCNDSLAIMSKLSQRGEGCSGIATYGKVTELTPDLELSQAIKTVKAAGYNVQKEMSSDELEKEAAQLFKLFTDKRDSFYNVLYQFIANNKKPKIELPVKETGVLNIPGGYNLTTPLRSYWNKDKVDLSEYPELKPLCKDIKTEIDNSKIPKNSIVKITTNMFTCVGFVAAVNNHGLSVYSSKTFSSDVFIKPSEIKSLEILALPEVEK